ncbi:MAG: chorismate mutase family protein [Bacteroidales bacterium]|nr:chorismate mutase family protein [Bacteroidales bacterium]
MTQCSTLSEVRENIDRIDDGIVRLIAERAGYVKQASSFKRNEAEVKAPDRVQAIYNKVREKAAEYGADPDMVEALYKEMIARNIALEMDDLKKKQ